MNPTCKGCTADNQEDVEAAGQLALRGEISWREAARRIHWPHHAPLKAHMENHFVEAQVAEARDVLDSQIEVAVGELVTAMRMAPAEVKPLYAAAIVNLRGLRDTKPSQQHLIMSLKTIQELTGMKQEQRMMLLFAERMFAEVPAPTRPALKVAPVHEIETAG